MPEFEFVEYTYTEEDRKRGYVIVGRKRLNLTLVVRKVIAPVRANEMTVRANPNRLKYSRMTWRERKEEQRRRERRVDREWERDNEHNITA